ncbi:hypothetical protein ABT063_01830 [Streptomyces sp. NPDC002838]|uniref:hypothetical protein n=1 Tax=Streptomyces sp. NPDC002838 TaxID=3154436 RepID=UPI00331ABA6A
MTSLVETLRARAWAARERVEESRSQLAALEKEYAVAKAKLSRLGITEDAVAELLAEDRGGRGDPLPSRGGRALDG